jgi:hypothetical protein
VLENGDFTGLKSNPCCQTNYSMAFAVNKRKLVSTEDAVFGALVFQLSIERHIRTRHQQQRQ